MATRCNCPRTKWAFSNLAVNVIRMMVALWIVLNGPSPAVIHHFTIIVFRLAVTIIIVRQGGSL